MKTISKLLILASIVGLIECKKKHKVADPSPPAATATEQYNYATLKITAVDIVGAGTTFSFTGTPKCKITYGGATLDSMLLLVATIHYSVEPSGVCSYFNGSYTTNSKNFKIRKDANNFLEFHDNTGLLGKWQIKDDGSPYSNNGTGNPQTQLFCCGSNKEFGFAGK